MKFSKPSKTEAIAIAVLCVVAAYDHYFGIFTKPSVTHKR